MKTINIHHLLFILLILSVSITSCKKESTNSSSSTSTSNDSKAGMNGSTITELAYSNQAEINFGQLANTKATNAGVKSFAQLMIQDHQKAQKQLDTLATQRSVVLPTNINTDQQKLRDTLNALTGFAFDSAYMNSQINAHTQTRDLMRTFADSTYDFELKDYISNNIPIVIAHLTKADSIFTSLKVNHK